MTKLFPFNPPLLLTCFFPLKGSWYLHIDAAELRKSGQLKPLLGRAGLGTAQPGMESKQQPLDGETQPGSAVCLYSAEETMGSCIAPTHARTRQRAWLAVGLPARAVVGARRSDGDL